LQDICSAVKNFNHQLGRTLQPKPDVLLFIFSNWGIASNYQRQSASRCLGQICWLKLLTASLPSNHFSCQKFKTGRISRVY